MTIVFTSLDQIKDRVGEQLPPGDWIEIDQQRVDGFADVTDDHQWIHVDPERAKDSVYGGTIAHGYLTASLLPALMRTVFRVEGAKMGVNYGSDGMRFPAPVLVGSKIRANITIVAVEEGPKGAQVISKTSVESDRGDRPVCVATTRSLLVF